MKLRIILISALLSISTYYAHSQIAVDFHLGMDYTGVRSTNGSVDINDVSSHKTAPRIGISGSYRLSDIFAIKTELNHVQSGFVFSEGISTQVLGLDIPIGVRSNASINFLEIPLMGQYYFGTETGTQFYVEGGPKISYGLHGKIRSSADLILQFNLAEIPIHFADDMYDRWNYGFTIGGGLEHKLNNSTALIGSVRYSRTTSNIISDENILGIDINPWAYTIGTGVKVSF